MILMCIWEARIKVGAGQVRALFPFCFEMSVCYLARLSWNLGLKMGAGELGFLSSEFFAFGVLFSEEYRTVFMK